MEQEAEAMRGYQRARCDKCKQGVSILIRIKAWNGDAWIDRDICPKCLLDKARE